MYTYVWSISLRLVDSVTNSVQWVVDDLGQSGLPNNWSSDNGWLSNGDWNAVGNGSRGSDGKWSSSEDSTLSPWLGFTIVGLFGSSISGFSFNNSLGMSSLSFLDLGSVFNWGWSNEDNWSWGFWTGWGNWKGVGGNLETTMTSGVFYSDFLAIRVDVSVASTDISKSITDSGMGLSRFGMSVGSLAKLILRVVLKIGVGGLILISEILQLHYNFVLCLLGSWWLLEQWRLGHCRQLEQR